MNYIAERLFTFISSIFKGRLRNVKIVREVAARLSDHFMVMTTLGLKMETSDRVGTCTEAQIWKRERDR